jgi:diphthamide synthase subunit DPH2
MTIDNHTVTVKAVSSHIELDMDEWLTDNSIEHHKEPRKTINISNAQYVYNDPRIKEWVSKALYELQATGDAHTFITSELSYTFESELDAVHFKLRWSEYL